MKFSAKDQKQVAGLFLLAAVCLGVYYAYVFRPLVNTVVQLGQAVHTQQTQLQAFKQLIAQESQLHQEQARLTATVQRERAALPSNQELPAVLERLATVASQAGVKVQTVMPQRVSVSLPTQNTPPLYKEIPIQIEGLAGFHQLGTFLSQIELGGQPMQVRKLHISENAKDPRRHTVEMTLIGYFATAQDPSSIPQGGSTQGAS